MNIKRLHGVFSIISLALFCGLPASSRGGDLLIRDAALFNSAGKTVAAGSVMQEAINGEGFFMVLLPEGTQAYTRDGDFHMAADGRWVTRDGYSLVGMQPMPPEMTTIAFTSHGEIIFGGPLGNMNFRVQLSRFPNPSGLSAFGTNLWRETAASGPPEAGNPGEDGFGRLEAGFLKVPGSFSGSVGLISGQTIFIEMSEDLKAWSILVEWIGNFSENPGEGNATTQPEVKLFFRNTAIAGSSSRFYRTSLAKVP